MKFDFSLDNKDFYKYIVLGIQHTRVSASNCKCIRSELERVLRNISGSGRWSGISKASGRLGFENSTGT